MSNLNLRYRPPREDEPTQDSVTRFATKVIVILGWFLGLFTAAMVVIFCVKDAVPDALVYATYGVAGVEAVSLAAKRIFDKVNKEDNADG